MSNGQRMSKDLLSIRTDVQLFLSFDNMPEDGGRREDSFCPMTQMRQAQDTVNYLTNKK